MGVAADLNLNPGGAIASGIVAGALSTLGYMHLTPFLAKVDLFSIHLKSIQSIHFQIYLFAKCLMCDLPLCLSLLARISRYLWSGEPSWSSRTPFWSCWSFCHHLWGPNSF